MSEIERIGLYWFEIKVVAPSPVSKSMSGIDQSLVQLVSCGVSYSNHLIDHPDILIMRGHECVLALFNPVLGSK